MYGPLSSSTYPTASSLSSTISSISFNCEHIRRKQKWATYNCACYFPFVSS
jgi:hypothetical protein